MKIQKYRRCFTAALVAMLGMLSAAADGSKTNPVTPEQRQVLDRFRTEYPDSFVLASTERILAGCAEEIRLMPVYEGTVFGKPNAGAYYRAFLERFQVKAFRRQLGEAVNFGGRIGEYGSFTQTLVQRHSGKEISLTGKYLDLWETAADGKLRLATQVWNYDRPLESGDDFRFAEVPAVQVALQAHVPVKGGISFDLAALNQLHGVAIAEHDGAVWSQFFADDAVLMPNLSPICRGRKAIDDYISAHVRQLSVFEKLDIRNDRIDDLGAFVIEYASHVANWRNGDSSGVNTGKNLRIWRREATGGLRLFWQIGNYD